MNDNSKLAKPIRSLTGLVRPKYSPGLLLQDDDLTAAVSYTRNLSRLMFRTLFGCGVLCGLQVSEPQKDNCGNLTTDIAKGVALSCKGDPIEVSASEVKIDTCENELPCFLWFAVRHIDACCVPRTAQCSPDEEEPKQTATRERDGFEIRVFPERPPCACGCRKLTPPSAPTAQQTPVAAGTSPRNQKLTAEKRLRGQTEAAMMSEQPAPAPAIPPSQAQPVAGVAAPSGCVDPEANDLETAPTSATDPCLCNLRTGTDSCYEAFYKGECACDCCDCDWIILAVAARQDEEGESWKVDHSVRRFVRPVLMRDWVVEEERKLPQAP